MLDTLNKYQAIAWRQVLPEYGHHPSPAVELMLFKQYCLHPLVLSCGGPEAHRAFKCVDKEAAECRDKDHGIRQTWVQIPPLPSQGWLQGSGSPYHSFLTCKVGTEPLKHLTGALRSWLLG
jgi:hypothetical protein